MEIDSLLGKTLGTCTIEALLNHGGMGTVYLASQLRPRRTVAIKVLLPGPDRNGQAQDTFLARFRREADAIAALDHIHIMPIYEYGEQEHLAYLVMPHITGGTLRHRLVERGALSLSEALPILEQATEALDYAHERGIIHRDIKPGNMLFHADGRLLLTDFGLAKILGESGQELTLAHSEQTSVANIQAQLYPSHQTSETTQVIELALPEQATGCHSCSSETIIGTPEYLAPERALGLPIDRRADIYALGIVLFQMLTGRVPFTGSSPISTALMHTDDEPPLPSKLVPDLTPEVEAVMLRAIAKDPAQRYQTAGDFARALRKAAASQHSHAPLNATPTQQTNIRVTPLKSNAQSLPSELPLNRNRSRVRNALFVALCSMLILGGAFSYLVQGTSTPHPVSAHAKKTPTAPPAVTPTNLPIPSPTPIVPTPSIPVGARLYASPLLDSACPGVQGAWSLDINARVSCEANATELSNSLPPNIYYLAGMFFNGLPDGSGIPNDYILHVEAVPAPGSQGYFGVLFRNQPDQRGHRHNGTYSLLINPDDGTWQAGVYDDVSGLPTYFANGQFAVTPDKSTIIDIRIQENTFTFYLNGSYQAQVTGPPNPNYSSGTLGFAVSTNTVALFHNLALYVLPTQ